MIGFNSFSRKNKAWKEVQKLKMKLLDLGFSAQPLIELRALVDNNSDPYVQGFAALELARWHADQGNPGDAEKCIDYLFIVKENIDDLKVRCWATVMEVECLEILGFYDKANKVISKYHDAVKSIDIFLAAANIEMSFSKRVGWINKVLEAYGLSKISVLKKEENTFFDMVDVSDAKKACSFDISAKSPKVSVIVTAYNAEDTISTAINSLLNQSWNNLEILVVNDCSSDSTNAMINEFVKKDNRVKLIDSGYNVGSYTARNLGLKVATGDYVTTHDSDDWSHPEKIEIQVQHLIDNSLVVANTSQQVGATNELKIIRRGNYGNLVFKNHSSLMFRREQVINQIGYWDCVRFGADQEYIIRIQRVFGKEAVVDLKTGPLSLVRISDRSLTRSNEFGTSGFFMGARREYKEAKNYFYATAGSLKFNFPQLTRPFPVPEPMWPKRETAAGGYLHFDIVIAADFRLDNNNISLIIKEIKKQKLLGMRTGLVQVSRYNLDPDKKINPGIRGILDGNSVQMLVYGQKISCDVFIVKDILAFQERQRFLPVIKTDNAHIIVDFMPDKELDFMFIKEYIGVKGILHPANFAIREALKKLNKIIDSFTISDSNWVDKNNKVDFESYKAHISNFDNFIDDYREPDSLNSKLSSLKTIPTTSLIFDQIYPLFTRRKKFAKDFIDEKGNAENEFIRCLMDEMDYNVRKLLRSGRLKVGNYIGNFTSVLTGSKKKFKPAHKLKKISTKYRKKIPYYTNKVEDTYTFGFWLQSVEIHYNALISSKRWMIGDKIISLINIFRPKKRNEFISTQDIQRVLKDYNAWLDEKKNGIANAGKGSIFYQKLYKALIDIDDKEVNLHIYKSEAEIEKQRQLFDQKEQVMPLVSIIMPTHNRAYLIGEAIHSILEQSYTNWELIIWDDGSNDNTEDAISRFLNDYRISYFKSPEREGAANARNHALLKARGKMLAFLDTDNLWHPHYLKVMVGHLLINKGSFSAYSRYLDVKIQGGSYYLHSIRKIPFNYEKLMKKNYIDTNSFIIKRELYDCLGGFSEGLQKFQDWDIALKYTFIEDPIYVNLFLVFYQRNEKWNQTTLLREHDFVSERILKEKVDTYYRSGVPLILNGKKSPGITILSTNEKTANGYLKGYHLARSLEKNHQVQLIMIANKCTDDRSFNDFCDSNLQIETWFYKNLDLKSFSELSDQLLPQINGDVVYTINPDLMTYGLGLLANYHSGKAICLEINSLDSLANALNQNHICDLYFGANGNVDVDLMDPFNVKWNSIMNYYAFNAPTLFTSNEAINGFFDQNGYCLRDIKEVNNVATQDKFKIKDQLKLGPKQKIILLVGDNIHKLLIVSAKLLDQANCSSWHIIVTGNENASDYADLEKKYSGMLSVILPGSINASEVIKVADAVLFWPDPKIAANQFKLNDLLTDALANKVPIIAGNISDFIKFGREGYIKCVDFNNMEHLFVEIKRVFEAEEKVIKMAEKAHNLFQRQFSYKAARTIFKLAYEASIKSQPAKLKVAEDFVGNYEKILKALNKR